MKKMILLYSFLSLTMLTFAQEVEAVDSAAVEVADSFLYQNVELATDSILALDSLDENIIYADSLLQSAFKYIGVRYMRGGMSSKGFDCSGFTTYIYSLYGISLLRSSGAQYRMGQKIEKEELCAGDLVFFQGRKSASVGHVGIVVENFGDGTFSFIHASCHSGVIISRSTEPYYLHRYVGAKRIVEME